MHNHLTSMTLVAALLTLDACSKSAQEHVVATSAEKPANPALTRPAEPSFATDAWLGKWNGPEGTYLELSLLTVGSDGRYRITIANLDGPSIYESLGHKNLIDDNPGNAGAGTIKSDTIQVDTIQFVRNCITESIRASDGKATGMKWLGDKHNCLTIRSGEGYCRD